MPHPAAEAACVPRPLQHGGARIDADNCEYFISIAAKGRDYYIRENLEKMRTHQNTTKAALPDRNLDPKSRTEVPIRNAVDLGELFAIFMRILLVFDRTQISENETQPSQDERLCFQFQTQSTQIDHPGST